MQRFWEICFSDFCLQLITVNIKGLLLVAVQCTGMEVEISEIGLGVLKIWSNKTKLSTWSDTTRGIWTYSIFFVIWMTWLKILFCCPQVVEVLTLLQWCRHSEAQVKRERSIKKFFLAWCFFLTEQMRLAQLNVKLSGLQLQTVTHIRTLSKTMSLHYGMWTKNDHYKRNPIFLNQVEKSWSKPHSKFFLWAVRYLFQLTEKAKFNIKSHHLLEYHSHIDSHVTQAWYFS